MSKCLECETNFNNNINNFECKKCKSVYHESL